MEKLTEKETHDKVVCRIRDGNKERFAVLDNLAGEKNFISGIFPDLIFQDKTSGETLFVVEVKKNGNIAQCLQQWKTIPNIPIILYLIVPEDELSNAKSIAQVIDIPVRFGTYKLDGENNEVTIRYE